jgi:hypothetical protein
LDYINGIKAGKAGKDKEVYHYILIIVIVITDDYCTAFQ